MTEGFDWLEAQHLLIENDELRNRVDELKYENTLLRAALKESEADLENKMSKHPIPSMQRMYRQAVLKMDQRKREERNGTEHEHCEGEAGEQ